LDEYWPGTSGLKNIKREAFTKNVYIANYEGAKVIVKSVPYDADLELTTDDNMKWVNYIGEDLSAATYIYPGVEHSDDLSKLITVSRFAPGTSPETFGTNAPWSWILDEAAVKAEGAWWGEFRKKSIEFAV
jgi:hypothetical protein